MLQDLVLFGEVPFRKRYSTVKLYIGTPSLWQILQNDRISRQGDLRTSKHLQWHCLNVADSLSPECSEEVQGLELIYEAVSQDKGPQCRSKTDYYNPVFYRDLPENVLIFGKPYDVTGRAGHDSKCRLAF